MAERCREHEIAERLLLGSRSPLLLASGRVCSERGGYFRRSVQELIAEAVPEQPRFSGSFHKGPPELFALDRRSRLYYTAGPVSVVPVRS